MAYDPNTQLTGWSYLGPSTGVTTTTVNLAYSYGYDAAQRTSGITVTDNGAASVRPITHDAAGRITSWSGPGGLQTWGYSGDGSIISDTMPIAGVNRTTVFTYSATQPDELVAQHTALDFALHARAAGPPRRFVLPCV